LGCADAARCYARQRAYRRLRQHAADATRTDARRRRYEATKKRLRGAVVPTKSCPLSQTATRHQVETQRLGLLVATGKKTRDGKRRNFFIVDFYIMTCCD